jgi:hypothetical protein
MASMRIWIAGYGGPPAAAIGAIPVWMATGDGSVAGATEALIDAYGGPFGGATAVWIAGYGGPPPASIGAVPIFIGGYAGAGGSAPSHSAEALAYLARTVGGNEGGNAANIATLIDGLVSDGVWAKIDALYILAQQNQADAQLNLISASYPLTGSGLGADPLALTFTPYVGFSGFVTGLDTGFDPTIAPGPHFTQNSATFGAWVYSYIIDSHPQMGSGLQSHLFIHYGGGFIARVNDVGGGAVSTAMTTGFFAGDRPNSTQVYPYMNGVSPGPNSTTAGALDNGTFLVGAARSGLGTTGDTLSAAFIGASLGAAGQLALYNRLRTYMTAIGVP